MSQMDMAHDETTATSLPTALYILRFLWIRRDYFYLLSQLVILVVCLATLSLVATDLSYHHHSDDLTSNLTSKDVVRAIKKSVKSIFVGPGNDTATVISALAQDLASHLLQVQRMEQVVVAATTPWPPHTLSPEESG